MGAYLSHLVGNEHIIMSSERAVFWENQSTLIVADLHIGKTGHFRKAGIGVPQNVYKDDLHRLLTQILFFKAERVIIVGDFSHSIANKELELFRKWRQDFSSLDVHLVKGNHDILQQLWYDEAGITTSAEYLSINNFAFVHDVFSTGVEKFDGQYIFSGHLHPGVVVSGRGRQSLRFPCFYFTNEYCVLPAFSRFTGTYRVSPGRGDNAFAIIDKDVVPLQ